MREPILTPDDVMEWMSCSRRMAIKTMRKIPSHWNVGVPRADGKGQRSEPRVLESELLKRFRMPKVHGISSRPVRHGRIIKFEVPKTAREMLAEYKAKKAKKAIG